MKPEANSDYMPLKTGEAAQIQLLYGFLEVTDGAEQVLKKRLQRCKQWRQFRTMQSWIKTMVYEVCQTIDPQKRQVFKANLCNQQLRVVNKSSINTTKDMTVVLTDDLYWIITDELQNHCAVCMGCGEDMRNCEFHKRLKRMTMFELDESGGVCMGKQIEKSTEV